MPLTAGTSLGPYLIVGPLGAGGMGEVYRARDPRLGRDVAIKALPAAFAQDTERVLRFEREAKLLASLSHPNIGAIYGLEESEGARYLVLELIEGETIAARLERGAIALDEALSIARQVVSALEAAHESGIVHRDLKPGNVMLAPTGTAKVLDFGLAKTGPGERSGADLAASPTMTQAATQAGMILGTAAYMSPEQARGRNVDRRADIWSFGCLLYEMLAGKQAFAGETVSDVLASILKTEPDWAALPAATPRRVIALLRRCLRKDPGSRLRDAGDVRIELEETMAGGTEQEAATPRRPGLPWLAASLVIVAVLAGWMLGRGSRPVATPSAMRFTIGAPPGAELAPETDAFVISPDGRTLALIAIDANGSSSLWVRELSSFSARPLAGTENAAGPFWSPDGRSIAFFADGKLKKVALAGGSSEVLGDAPDPRGGSWGSHGTILFAPIATGGLFSIPSAGGSPTEVLAPDPARGETALRYPCLLPDGRHFLFLTLPRRDGSFEVHLGDLDERVRWPITRAGAVPAWAEPGYLILVQNDLLVAQRFDLGARQLEGEPISLGPAPIVVGPDGLPAVSVSSGGVLLRSSAVLANTQMTWLDRAGRVQAVVPLPAGRWEGLRISPDGRSVAVLRRTSTAQTDLWLVDLASGVASRFAPSIRYSQILWAPDGRRVLYQLSTAGPEDLYVKSVNGGAAPELLYHSAVQFKNAFQWTEDGRFVTFASPDPATGWDAWLLPVDGERTPIPLLRSPANETSAWLSPDQRSLVYVSDESGRSLAYVQSYPTPGARQQLATTGLRGRNVQDFAHWSSDGRELVVAGGDVFAIPLEPGAELRPGTPRLLFSTSPDVMGLDVTSDHERFLVTVPVADAAAPGIAVESDWRVGLGLP